MHLSRRLVGLYPRWWRRRYGDEMLALIEDRPLSTRDPFDLVRGAVDAWLHPPTRSWIPPIAALAGGGLWTVVAVAITAQPSPPDWPGYLLELVPLALAAVVLLLGATLGCALRAGDDHSRAAGLVSLIVFLGSVAWIGALALTLAAVAPPAALAAAQSIAVIGIVSVGVVLIRAGDAWVGSLLVIAGGSMLVPWIGAWVAYGATWTAIGIVLVLDRLGPADGGLRTA